MSADETIADLQMRLTYQEDDIKALNRVVLEQQEQIDRLKRDVTRLHELIAAMVQAEAAPTSDERPPHY